MKFLGPTLAPNRLSSQLRHQKHGVGDGRKRTNQLSVQKARLSRFAKEKAGRRYGSPFTSELACGGEVTFIEAQDGFA